MKQLHYSMRLLQTDLFIMSPNFHLSPPYQRLKHPSIQKKFSESAKYMPDSMLDTADTKVIKTYSLFSRS